MNLPPPNVDQTPPQAEALLDRLIAEHQHGIISDGEMRSVLPRLRWRDSTGQRYTLGVRSRTWFSWDGRGWVAATPPRTLQIDLDPLTAPVVDPMSPLEEPPAPQTASGWAPTHLVPEGGMQAWTSPDPSTAPVTTLAAAVELQVLEQRGDWAKVVGWNGWSGWVDVRRLTPRA